MALTNSTALYGGVTKTFHWLTALLILTAMPLGVVANGLPYDTGDQLATKALVFSLHKTMGIAAFAVGVLRILWAMTQSKPWMIAGDKPVQAWLAETVHWLLYASLVIVPLSGWLHHAATTGFAPILWPFGQSLPFVPKDPGLAHFFAGWHYVFTKVLLVAVLLHIAGALKHHFVDRDATLRRMWFGALPAPKLPQPADVRGPVLAAAAIYAAAMVGGGIIGLSKSDQTLPGVELASVASGWTVQDGQVAITVRQLGSDVRGSFTNWTAAIAFDETVSDGAAGTVEVSIAVPSLSLGSVTSQAMGADFFNAAAFPVATYSGQIIAEGGAYRAEGTLSLKQATQPVTFPFDLTVEGDKASMTAQTTVQRLDFGIGETYPDESSLAFPVIIDLAVTATRSGS